MKHETRPKGHHEDFASDRPEHVERQGAPECKALGCTRKTKRANGMCWQHFDLGQSAKGFPPETGPDTRQPEMVIKQRALEILDNALGMADDGVWSYAQALELARERIRKL